MNKTLIFALNRIDGERRRIQEKMLPRHVHIVTRTWDIRGLCTADMERIFTAQFMDNKEALRIMEALDVTDLHSQR